NHEVDEPGKSKDERDEDQEFQIEQRLNMQLLRAPKVLPHLLSKLMNREKRWTSGVPRMRMYLPPVGMDGIDADIRDEWEGPVKAVKIKGGIVCVLHEMGKTMRLWDLDHQYQRLRDMADALAEEHREVLEKNERNGMLRSLSEKEAGVVLECVNLAGKPCQPKLRVVRLRHRPELFDFFPSTNRLITASAMGIIDVYDLETGKHLREFRLEDVRIGSLHIWMEFIVVGHGTQITLLNHKTGEVLEDALQTAHQYAITAVFVLDNDNHMLSVDESGVIVVTDRSKARRDIDTLLNTPLHPLIYHGNVGAPYAMRLLHMSHLCVYGKYTFGQYELYPPGIDGLPPISELMLTGGPEDEQDHGSNPPVDGNVAAADSPGSANSGDGGESAAGHTPAASTKSYDEERRETLKQLLRSERDVERMYSEIIGDRDGPALGGRRMQGLRQNTVPQNDRYHILNINSRFADLEGNIATLDFRRVLYQANGFIRICELGGGEMPPVEDLEHPASDAALGVSLGLYPVDASTDLGPASSEHAEALKDIIEELELQMPGGFGSGEGQGDLVDETGWSHMLVNDEPVDLNDLDAVSAKAMRAMFAIRYATDVPDFGRVPFSVNYLRSAVKFLQQSTPDLFHAVQNPGLGIDALSNSAPYYIQKHYESRFKRPVDVVDHRGQVCDAQAVMRDMNRLYRALRKTTAMDDSVLIGKGVRDLKYVASAMDDSRLVVGCRNGYVVVTSFE
ncbi:hypothetical protein EC988_003618, partial [Linderina pennispora]